MRKHTQEMQIGKVKIGGNNPIAVQSMLSLPSYDLEENVEQALELKNAGCDILRVAIPDMDSIKLIDAIKQKVDIPLVADIHFDYKLAIESISAGIDKVRINPGNIGSEENVKAVAKACTAKNIPIRIGVNSGSLEKNILKKYTHPSPQAMCESALYNASLLEKFDFNNIAISLKSSSVQNTIEAYRLMAKKCVYPLHLGVTEAGTEVMGTIKSAIGIGSLLADGIGDTIRVSLTANPVKEIEAGINILKALNLYKNGIKFISCPTCGRTRIDVIKIANKIETALKDFKSDLTVAIMGCVVNGPGEAKEADIGIAGGNGCAVIFKKGQIFKKVDEEDIVPELLKEIKLMSLKNQ